MLSDGHPPRPRSWPSGSQRSAPRRVEAAREDLGSATERGVGLIPGDPRDCAARAGEVDRRCLGLDPGADVERRALRDPLAPFLNARTKICWELPTVCSNVAHGTRAAPASEPPAMSERPAFWVGSMPAVGSLLTCCPLPGSPSRSAAAVAPAARTPAAARITARRASRPAARDRRPSPPGSLLTIGSVTSSSSAVLERRLLGRRRLVARRCWRSRTLAMPGNTARATLQTGRPSVGKTDDEPRPGWVTSARS